MAEPHPGASFRGDTRTTHGKTDLGQHRGRGLHRARARGSSVRVGGRGFRVLGLPEGTYAFPCGVGEGMHIADDLVILEPADADGNVVPYGQPADRLLLTNLYNLAQPLIRYDLVDAVTISDEPFRAVVLIAASRRSAVGSTEPSSTKALPWCPGRPSSRLSLPPPASPTSSSARRNVVSTFPW